MADPAKSQPDSKSSAPAPPKHGFQEKLRRGVAAFFRLFLPAVLLAILAITWYSSLVHQRQYDGYKFGYLVLIVFFLLLVLLLLEAMEIAYSVQRDKLPDQFGEESERPFFVTMHTHEHVIYDAREWLFILILAIIAFIAEIATHEGVYFLGREVPGREFAKLVFAVMFTTLPIVWFAQAPGKDLAKSHPRRILFSGATRAIWRCLRWVDIIVQKTDLDAPAKLVTKAGEKLFGTAAEPNTPSDHGLFFASLQRYGFVLHDLLIHIDVLPDGSCKVRQRVVIYLMGYPRTNFRRELFFDARAEKATFARVEGYYQCPVAQDSYEAVSKDLDDITAGRSSLPSRKDSELGFCEPKMDGRRMTFEVTTYKKLPEENRGGAIAIECEGTWAAGAMKTSHGEEDWFEQSFSFPCRRYRLEIVPDPSLNMHLSEIQASATFMNNPHAGEEKRLEKAREDTNRAILSTLEYPLPGAKYKYHWRVVRT